MRRPTPPTSTTTPLASRAATVPRTCAITGSPAHQRDAGARGAGVGVADRDGGGGGGCVGVQDVLEAQDDADHLLDLVLAGAAVGGDGLLDLGRGVLLDRQAALGGGEDGDAARLADGHRRGDVLREEQLLDRDLARAV